MLAFYYIIIMPILDELTKSQILLQYCKQAAISLKHRKIGTNYILTECPFCGSQKLKGTIYIANTNRLCYICWRANCPAHDAMIASKWLAKVNPALFMTYKEDLYNKMTASEEDLSKLQAQFVSEHKKMLIKQQEEINEKKLLDKSAAKNFVQIDDGTDLSKKAIEYCKSRKIPEEIWKKFYICHTGKYHDRLIIPFYNKAGKIEFWQGRTLINLEPKYMNRIADTQLYNRDFIDLSKPVIVLEGPIDSMFIENAVATCGAGSSSNLDSQLAKYEQLYYILDNDEAGNKKAGKLVRSHKNVFIWRKFLTDFGLNSDEVKDVNDVILKLNKSEKFTFKDLQNYFTNITDEFMCYL